MRKIVVAAALATLPGGAWGATVSVSTTSSLSTGKYGGTDATHVAVSAVGVTGTFDNGWQLSMTLPYVAIDTSDAGVAAGGVIVRPSRRGGRIFGYSDLTLRAARPVQVSGLPFEISARGQVKVPTGAKRFSSGKPDFSGGAEISRSFGRASLFASADYNVLGDRKDLRLRDGWSLGTGAAISFPKSLLMLTYERSRSGLTAETAEELFGVVTRQITPAWGLTFYGSKGMSTPAAQLMVGMSVTRKLIR